MSRGLVVGWLIVAVACGRVGFDPRAASDGRHDSGTSCGVVTCPLGASCAMGVCQALPGGAITCDASCDVTCATATSCDNFIVCSPGETCTIHCDTPGSCTNTTVSCTNATCIFDCGDDTCDGLTIECSGGTCAFHCCGSNGTICSFNTCVNGGCSFGSSGCP